MEGYANLEHWVAELDKRIEGILLQRLSQIAQVWCAEFDRADHDVDVRRGGAETMPLRDITNKRRGDKRVKEEKVMCYIFMRVRPWLIWGLRWDSSTRGT